MKDQSNDGSDENEGKYSTDQEMTFEDVLKQSLREDDESNWNHSDSSKTHQLESGISSRDTENSSKQEREESDSARRVEFAEAIAETYTPQGPPLSLAHGETGAIGLETTYDLGKATVNDQTVYFIGQNTIRSPDRFSGTLAIKDFGETWGYDVLDVDPAALKVAFGEQRRDDYRACRDPVDQLSESQLEAVVRWYQQRTKLELHGIKTGQRHDDSSFYLFDRYLVVELDRSDLLVGGELRELSDRQTTIVQQSLFDIVKPNIEVPPAIVQDLRRRIEYPLIAKVVFQD